MAEGMAKAKITEMVINTSLRSALDAARKGGIQLRRDGALLQQLRVFLQSGPLSTHPRNSKKRRTQSLWTRHA